MVGGDGGPDQETENAEGGYGGTQSYGCGISSATFRRPPTTPRVTSDIRP